MNTTNALLSDCKIPLNIIVNKLLKDPYNFLVFLFCNRNNTKNFNTKLLLMKSNRGLNNIEFNSFIMGIDMKENGKIIKCMGKEYITMPMEPNMMENGKRMKNTE